MLNGHESTQSEWVCIKHFNPKDFRRFGDKFVLRRGAAPDPNRILTNDVGNTSTDCSTLNKTNNCDLIDNHEQHSMECKNCDSLQNEVLHLRKQMAAMEREHNLQLSQREENFRKISTENERLVDKVKQCKAKLGQLNRLVNEMTVELMVNELQLALEIAKRRSFKCLMNDVLRHILG